MCGILDFASKRDSVQKWQNALNLIVIMFCISCIVFIIVSYVLLVMHPFPLLICISRIGNSFCSCCFFCSSLSPKIPFIVRCAFFFWVFFLHFPFILFFWFFPFLFSFPPSLLTHLILLRLTRRNPLLLLLLLSFLLRILHAFPPPLILSQCSSPGWSFPTGSGLCIHEDRISIIPAVSPSGPIRGMGESCGNHVGIMK